eukprot:TRINITY_DN10322_c0_g1_i1.p1 TRINITY_DN10322_c0_g1~~TRINITY_DN10322_c0_g1_i1.p1  ORF type:complete len:203 (-),score=33.44 TRINITY_DN10322_c0_g1_i1:34-642(-)
MPASAPPARRESPEKQPPAAAFSYVVHPKRGFAWRTLPAKLEYNHVRKPLFRSDYAVKNCLPEYDEDEALGIVLSYVVTEFLVRVRRGIAEAGREYFLESVVRFALIDDEDDEENFVVPIADKHAKEMGLTVLELLLLQQLPVVQEFRRRSSVSVQTLMLAQASFRRRQDVLQQECELYEAIGHAMDFANSSVGTGTSGWQH